jgi:hypothetical protein
MRTRIPIVVAALAALVVAAAAPASAAAGWTIVPSPTPSPGSDLNAVAVPGTADAWAVGKNHRYGSDHQMVIEHWDGTAWTVAAAPNSRCYNEALFGITFMSAANGWAVGETPTSAHRPSTCGSPPRRGALVVHWDGSGWSVMDTPVPASGTGTLRSVSAVSASDAWAVGRSAYGSPLVLHLTGGTWRNVSVPTADLAGVAVVSAGNVWAVGFTTTSGGTAPAILHYNGSAWSRATVPAVPGALALTAVTAIAANDVWAAGYANSGGGIRPMMLHYNGSAWSQASLPALPDGGTGRLEGLAARSATDVWAVGAQSVNRTLTMHYNGSGWSIVPSPNNDTADPNDLNGVAVSRTSGETWAVGHWNGTVPWTLTMRYR